LDSVVFLRLFIFRFFSSILMHWALLATLMVRITWMVTHKCIKRFKSMVVLESYSNWLYSKHFPNLISQICGTTWSMISAYFQLFIFPVCWMHMDIFYHLDTCFCRKLTGVCSCSAASVSSQLLLLFVYLLCFLLIIMGKRWLTIIFRQTHWMFLL
jgi:hypothetical protein